MNIADAVNPFLFQHQSDPVRDAASKLITQAGVTTIFSAVNEVAIANHPAVAQYATVVTDEYDLVVYGLDVVLASDLLHKDRGTQASRNISIFCRKLTILGSDDKGLTIDVSATDDARLTSHTQPTVSISLANASQRAAPGNDIAYALNNPSPNNPWSNWFTKDPGAGWATKGAKGGAINIACETLVLNSKLHLKANGGRGNGGVGGQNVKNWMPGLRGGDAGQGGVGGDSGTIQLTCNRVLGKDGKPVDLLQWVDAESVGGSPGDPGLPGAAYDPSQGNNHYGAYAGPVASGASSDAAMIQPPALPYGDGAGNSSVADVSMVAANSSLHFWALLYHLVKLQYLQNQPMKFRMPDANNASWVALGDLLKWTNRFAFAYGDTSAQVKDACLAEVAKDAELDGKNTIARALKLMLTWYMAGKTMWGQDVTAVFPLPLETLCSYVDHNFVHQQTVRDFYIRLRKELADAIKANQALATMSNSAEYAVQMHQAVVDDLRKLLFGSSDNSGVDSLSLVGELNDADSACNGGIDSLSEDLKGLDDKIKSAIGIGVKDVLDSVKSMLFVAGDMPAFLAMGAIEGYSLYDKAKNDVVDDTGNAVAKSAVIQQVHDLKGSVDDLSKAVNGMVSNDQVGHLDQAILTSLDNVDAYVSKFTKALGDVGQKVLDDIAALRQKVNYKNELWLAYNDKLYQLAKEWDEYQAALAKKQEIDTSSQQELSADLINAVQLYTGIYLSNLERTAELWARLLRKFAYVTLDADLPDADFLGSVSAFWQADSAGAQAMADQANGNWDIDKSAVVGAEDSSSIRYQLGLYNAGSQAIVLKAPDDASSNLKSTFYVTIRGGGSQEEQSFIGKLLTGAPVWLQVVPADGFNGRYTNANGEISDPPKPGPGVLACPLMSGNEWDARITHVNPWIEGIDTDSHMVKFHIKLGVKSYIVDASSPPLARYYGYDGKAMNTEFAHFTDAKLSDPTNQRMAGGAGGEVTDENVDKRGIFTQLQLGIPSEGLNAGLHAVGATADVNLRIHFRVIFRASVKAAQDARAAAMAGTAR
jgi:hypothetical protein